MSMIASLRRTRRAVHPAADRVAPELDRSGRGLTAPEPSDGCSSIGQIRWREPANAVGRVRALRIQPRADVPTLECTLVDDTGGITVVFLGRREVPGIRLGCRMRIEGVAGVHHGRLAILNPDYTLLA